jgi:hypothetical protein
MKITALRWMNKKEKFEVKKKLDPASFDISMIYT